MSCNPIGLEWIDNHNYYIWGNWNVMKKLGSEKLWKKREEKLSFLSILSGRYKNCYDVLRLRHWLLPPYSLLFLQSLNSFLLFSITSHCHRFIRDKYLSFPNDSINHNSFVLWSGSLAGVILPSLVKDFL